MAEVMDATQKIIRKYGSLSEGWLGLCRMQLLYRDRDCELAASVYTVFKEAWSIWLDDCGVKLSKPWSIYCAMCRESPGEARVHTLARGMTRKVFMARLGVFVEGAEGSAVIDVDGSGGNAAAAEARRDPYANVEFKEVGNKLIFIVKPRTHGDFNAPGVGTKSIFVGQESGENQA